MVNLDEIKAKLDIVDVVGSYIELRRAGANYRALSPFKTEKTPSFFVSPALQIYKDFSSGNGGDVIKFIQEMERVSFPEAIKLAAERAGIQLEENFYHIDHEKEEKKVRNIEANEFTSKFYHHILMVHKLGKPGRDYALKRKLTSKELEKFMFGYAPSGKYNLKNFLLKKGFSESELIEFGLVIDRSGDKVDKFRNRLMQPVRDIKGNVLGFSGRYFGENKEAPKYLNSPETPAYKKNEVLYGLFEALREVKDRKKLIVVEGNLDVVSSHRAGIEFIVAPLGTSFTEKQAKLAKRYADEILFCFDTDEAGIGALIRSIKICEDLKLPHKVLDLKNFHDTDDMVSSEPNLWQKTIENPINTYEYIINIYKKDLDLGSVDGKENLKNKMLPILRLIKDSVVKNHFIKQVAVLVEITTEELLNEVSKEKSFKRIINLESEEESAPENEVEEYKANITKKEKFFLALILSSDEVDKIYLTSEVFENADVKKLLGFINSNEGIVKNCDFSILESPIKDLYKEIVLTDIPDKVTKYDLQDAYKVLYKEYLNKEILRLRKSSDKSSQEVFVKLNELTKKLKELQKK